MSLVVRFVVLLWALRPWAFRRPGLAFAIEGGALALLLLLILGPYLTQKLSRESKSAVEPSVSPTSIGLSKPSKDFTNSVGMTMVSIPAGKIRMGSPPTEIERCLKLGGDKELLATEGPEHEVEITRPFYMAATPVTVGQFRQFVNDKKYNAGVYEGMRVMIDGKYDDGVQDGPPSWQKVGFTQTDEHPVVYIAWNNAADFCTWLSEKEGKTYRLPTEAEWEYCCRAGKSGTRYCFGDDDARLLDYAWSGEKLTGGNSAVGTHPVGKKKPNDWELYDMHGNVMEWCLDNFNPQFYKDSPKKNPRADQKSAGSWGWMVARGAESGMHPVRCRSASRSYVRAIVELNPRWSGVGFRVVQVP